MPSWCWNSPRLRLPVVRCLKCWRAGKTSTRRPSPRKRRISANVRLKRISVALLEAEKSWKSFKLQKLLVNEKTKRKKDHTTLSIKGTSTWPPAFCRAAYKTAWRWNIRSSNDRHGRRMWRSHRELLAVSFLLCSDADEELRSNLTESRNEPGNRKHPCKI